MSFDLRISRRLAQRKLEIQFDTGPGITALFGPSGVGKTSVLNMVAGVMRPDSGRIQVGGIVLFDHASGIDLSPEQRHAGYIFQDGRLFPHMTVRGNLLYGARLRRREVPLVSLDEAVALLGIDALLERRPDKLSGGEAQRVAIGRALLSAPRFLLMDEPLTFLDDARREEILTVIERVRDELRLPILYVSHDRAEVTRLGASIIAME